MTLRLSRFRWGALGLALFLLVGGSILWWKPWLSTVPAGTDPPFSAMATPMPHPPAIAPPEDAVHVDPAGDLDADGTAQRPFSTVSEAIRRARPGGTVVVNSGTYHEQVHIPEAKPLTLRAAPGATVWLDGSRRAVSFRRASDGRYVFPDQAPQLDRSPTYRRGAPDGLREGWRFVSSDHPLASDPAQVWLDGKRLRQTHPASAVTSGTFAVDGQDVVIGDDPRGREVRVGTLSHGLVINAADSRVEGIGLRRFVPSVPDFGAVVLGANHLTLQGVVVSDASTTGVSVQGENATLEDVAVVGSGMLGVHAHRAHGLTVVGSRLVGNNTLGFNMAPVAGGMKITEASGVLIERTVADANRGTGIWLDEGVTDSRVTSVEARGNSLHGTLIELCARVTVTDSRFTDNDGSGVRVQNSGEIDVTKITSSGNRRGLDFVQDGRLAGSPGAPPVPSDPRLQPMTWRIGDSLVAGNILGPNSGDADLAVEDFTGRLDADSLGFTLHSNVYRRPRTGGARWTHVWCKPGADPDVYESVETFARLHHQDKGSTQVDGAAAASPPAANRT